MVWDYNIAPFDVHIIPINYKNELIKKQADLTYQNLINSGIECIIDDRNFSPGFKFRDADLLGMPLQVIIGEKNLNNNKIELKFRKTGKKDMIPISESISNISEIILKQK